MTTAKQSWVQATYLRLGSWAPCTRDPEQSGLSRLWCEWSRVEGGGQSLGERKSVLFPQPLGYELFIWSFRTCKDTHSTKGYILSLACSIVLEVLVTKGKNSWGFFSMTIIKRSGPFFDPLPLRLHAALCSHLDTTTLAIILVSFRIFLGSSISQGSQPHEMLYKRKNKKQRKVFQNVPYIQLNAICLSINMYFQSWNTII